MLGLISIYNEMGSTVGQFVIVILCRLVNLEQLVWGTHLAYLGLKEMHRWNQGWLNCIPHAGTIWGILNMGYSEIVWRAYLNQKSLKLSLRFFMQSCSVKIHKLSLQSSHALKLPGKVHFTHLCPCVRGVYFTQKKFLHLWHILGWRRCTSEIML